eukprot:gene5840-4164_t
MPDDDEMMIILLWFQAQQKKIFPKMHVQPEQLKLNGAPPPLPGEEGQQHPHSRSLENKSGSLVLLCSREGLLCERKPSRGIIELAQCIYMSHSTFNLSSNIC